MGSGHIILLILRLKRLNFASNMAVDSNTPIFGRLIFKFQQTHVPYPQSFLKRHKSSNQLTGLAPAKYDICKSVVLEILVRNVRF